jgi:cytochrome c553
LPNLEGEGKVAACATCHGEAGEGNAQLGAPRIGGQHARYTASQLRAFASGARADNGSGMAAIAAAMSDEQITAIAAFLDTNQTGVMP